MRASVSFGRVEAVNGGPTGVADTISYDVLVDVGNGLVVLPGMKPRVRPPMAEQLEVYAFEVGQVVRVVRYAENVWIDDQEYFVSAECPTGS